MIILSLFDHSGVWSKPYRDAGYEVIQIDIKHGQDILTWDYKQIPKEDVIGILAAPPCTDYAVSGARWFAAKDKDGRTEESLKLIDKTLDVVKYFEPEFWVLENPVGRLQRLRPEIGKPSLIFQPYEFGDPYRKRTCLWGNFNTDLTRTVVEPQGVRKGQPDEWYSKVGGSSEATKEYRSKTSEGFAKAFFEANKKEKEEQ